MSSGSRFKWEDVFGNIFPGLGNKSFGYWKKLKHREQFIARCFTIGDLRNRVAHFEPIWKFWPEYEEVIPKNNSTPAVINNAPINKNEMLIRLRSSIEKTIELLKWLSPTAYDDYLNSESFKSLNWLVTDEGIETFIKYKDIKSISFNRMTKARTMKKLVRGSRGCSMIMIEKNAAGVLFLYP